MSLLQCMHACMKGTEIILHLIDGEIGVVQKLEKTS